MRRISFASLVIVATVSVFGALGCGEAVPAAPGVTRQATNDNFCGGIEGRACPAGQICKLDGDYPDAAGHCIGQNFECATDDDCFHTGCSRQLCANQVIVTTCEFKCDYGCYAKAGCGCVAGHCQFDTGRTLAQCLSGCNGPVPTGQVCGSRVCPTGEVCCNDSCSICMPPGGVCTQEVCLPSRHN